MSDPVMPVTAAPTKGLRHRLTATALLTAVGIAAFAIGSLTGTYAGLSAHDELPVSISAGTWETDPEPLVIAIRINQAINPGERGTITVRVDSAEGFDPSRDLALDTLRFGSCGSELATPRGSQGGANNFRIDFSMPDTGIESGDEVCLIGNLKDGTPFVGRYQPKYSSSSVETVDLLETHDEADAHADPDAEPDKPGGSDQLEQTDSQESTEELSSDEQASDVESSSDNGLVADVTQDQKPGDGLEEDGQ